jgi:hypothetical protein
MSIKPIAPLTRNPRTRREWQAAADGAHTLLLLDSARQYGLIEGGPEINAERCEEILYQASRKKITPQTNLELIRELTS